MLQEQREALSPDHAFAALPAAVEHPLVPLGVALGAAAATLPPLLKGATPGYPGIEAGAFAERLNGRLAMSALAVAAYVEFANGEGVVAWFLASLPSLP